MTSQLAAKGSLLVRLISQKFHQYLASSPKDESFPSREYDEKDSGLPGINEETSPSPQMKALDPVPAIPAAPTLDVNPNKLDHGDRFFLQTVDSILSDASSFDQSFDEYNTAQYDGARDVKEEIQDSMDEHEDLETSDVEERCSSPLSDKYQRLRVSRDMNRAKERDTQEVKVQTRGQITDVSQRGDESGSESIGLTETDKDSRSMSASANVVQNQAQEEDHLSDDRSTSGGVRSVSQPGDINQTVSEEDDQLDQQSNGNEMQTVNANTSFAEYEDRIFSSLDDAKRDELMMYIVQHPFVRQISEQQASRRRFMQDIRREAGAAGMNNPDIDLLEKHVWQLYLQMFEIESAEPLALEATEDTVVENQSLASKKKQDKEKRKRGDADESSRKAKKKKKEVKEEHKADGEDTSSQKLEKKKPKEKRKSADADESSQKSKDDGKRKTLGEEEPSDKLAKRKRKKTKSHSRSPMPSDCHTDNVDVVPSADEPAAPTDETTTPVDNSAVPVGNSVAPVVDLAATADESGPIDEPAVSVNERAASVEEITRPVYKLTTSPEKSALVTINKPETPASLKKASAPVTLDKNSPSISRRTPSRIVPVQKRTVLAEMSSPIVIDTSEDEKSVVYQQSDDGDTDSTDCVIVKPEAVTTSIGLSSFPMSPISPKAQALPSDSAGPKTPKARKQKSQRSETPPTVTRAAKADKMKPTVSQQEARSQPVLGEVGSAKRSEPSKPKQHPAEFTSMQHDVVNIEDLELHPQKPGQDDPAASGDGVSTKTSKSRKRKQRSSELSSTDTEVAIATRPNLCPSKPEQSAHSIPGDAAGVTKPRSHPKKRRPSGTSAMGAQNDSSTLCLSRPDKRALQPASANTMSTDAKTIKSAALVHSEPSSAPDKTPEQIRREKKREKFRLRRKQKRLRKQRAKANNGALDQGQQSKQTASRETGSKEKAKPSSKAMSKESLDGSFWKLDF